MNILKCFSNRIRRDAKINDQNPAEFAKTFMEKLEKMLHKTSTRPTTKADLTQLGGLIRSGVESNTHKPLVKIQHSQLASFKCASM